MAKTRRKFITIDCETDPFKYGRIPKPFLWGCYDGKNFLYFNDTNKFASWLEDQDVWAFAHNGGKFDFHFLTEYFIEGKPKIINGRIVEIKLGKCTLRDSYAIMPVPLAAYEKTKIDYEMLEANVRADHMQEIISYLKDDCVYLYDMIEKYFENAGRKITLASNALAKSKALGIDPGRTNKRYDEKFRRFYFGGRCQAFRRGEFHNIDIFDIKSAYPYAMTFNHPSGNAIRLTTKLHEKSRGQQCFWKIKCNSLGAFPVREKAGLSFPHVYGEFHVTGWELYAALENELIDNFQIIEGYEFYDEINFSEYVTYWFAQKEMAEKSGDKINRLISKLMLNSLYGKLCQNPENFMDYKIVPKNSDIEKNWNLECILRNSEIHSRIKSVELKERLGEDYANHNQFINVATGASITGFVRAMLIETIAKCGAENVIYCDTDSVFTRAGTGPKISDSIGGWQLEAQAETLYIAGKKLYAARLDDGKEKIASKGVQLNFDEIRQICGGNIVTWSSNAPSFNLTGSTKFVKRRIARSI